MASVNAQRPPIVGADSGPEPPFPLRLDGEIIKGFGRGSKEVSPHPVSSLCIAFFAGAGPCTAMMPRIPEKAPLAWIACRGSRAAVPVSQHGSAV